MFTFETDAYLAPLGCGANIAVACTFKVPGGPGQPLPYPYLLDVDTAFNKSAGLEVDGNKQGDGSDVWGIGAHEMGHQVGLDHVTSTDNLMYGGVGCGSGDPNCVTGRKLGKGEAGWVNAIY